MDFQPVAIIILTFITLLTAHPGNTTAASSANAMMTSSKPTTATVITSSAVTSSSDLSATTSTADGPIMPTATFNNTCYDAAGGREHYKEYYNSDSDNAHVVRTSQLITVSTLVASTTICVVAFGFVWASLFLIHFKVRRLQSMNEKVVFAEELLKHRKIPQSLLSRLGRLAHFDEQQNERETQGLLKSMSSKKDPKPKD